MTARPSIKSPCAADRYVTGNERIAEFSAPNGKGGLIRIMQQADDRVTVDVYRTDDGVEIRTGQPAAARAMLAALTNLANILEADGDLYPHHTDHARKAIALAESAGITTEGN